MLICRDFYGSDGTRTRDLRRDRPAVSLGHERSAVHRGQRVRLAIALLRRRIIPILTWNRALTTHTDDAEKLRDWPSRRAENGPERGNTEGTEARGHERPHPDCSTLGDVRKLQEVRTRGGPLEPALPAPNLNGKEGAERTRLRLGPPARCKRCTCSVALAFSRGSATCAVLEGCAGRSLGSRFWDTSGTHVAIIATKTPDLRGFLKRMKGLEPSTFCMAKAGGRSRRFARVR
jgi:hypothetical protein